MLFSLFETVQVRPFDDILETQTSSRCPAGSRLSVVEVDFPASLKDRKPETSLTPMSRM